MYFKVVLKKYRDSTLLHHIVTFFTKKNLSVLLAVFKISTQSFPTLGKFHLF